ncbi:mutS protein homolog 4-like isoform X1 [Spodoptera frugiperda]|uniref:MutS protein homolog 4-like isoform X1 n=3 Tax=Spodoptera frugiperda TaxID=7108 RepID=A0A9R0E430_SPOFR|nr:mutS protein homolog 4-like isoform X1 [Spodoptera frugiperda]
MNVVPRVKRVKPTMKSKFNNDFIRKDTSLGIRGATSLVPLHPFSAPKVTSTSNKAPKYQFDKDDAPSGSTRRPAMGPPSGPPKSFKRKIIHSASSHLESSSSGRPHPRVLANDSAAADTSHDMCTPKNRPTALRYISSSSRAGYSGTRSARSTSVSAADASVILAISEGRGMARGEIGIAAIDLRHPHLVLCQFSDTLLYTHTLTKINFFNPIEIIVPHTFCEGVQPNQLYQLIRDRYPLVNLVTVQRRHFNDAAGRQNIQTLCAPQYSGVYLQVVHKFYAVTAAAAVLKYVEYIQCIVFARESLKIEYHSSENTMIIDVGTATQLELVQPLVPSAGPTCCLLGVLGPTYTIGGIRALRASILQPSCNKDYIESRLDAVQDLIDNDTGLIVDLQDVIKKLSDVDKILLLCMESANQNMDKVGEAQLNQTLLLKVTMDLVPKLVEALNGAASGRLRKIKMDFENPHYNEIAERIKRIIQDDAHLEKGAMGSLQRCFAVKPDINGLLDVARRTYSELIEDIQKIVEQLSETYDLTLRLNQNMMKGFHIVLPLAPKSRRCFNIEDLPPIFIQVHHSGASVTMTTEELVVLNQQAKESLNEIQKMSNIVISSLLKELRPFMPSLYTLCENVAELDVLLALAQASSVGSYIRSEFNSYMDVRNSVHPLLDYNSQVLPVPNDILATPEHNFTIITGPNMGGKSIYIKQVAIMQVMAQIGCFLPATNAILRLCDRIFSRIGFNDSVELNASTYVFEIKETQHILKGLTPTSLVIIDELCRGTCVEEGTSVAWAICEELIMSNAFTFFTTHFMYLTRLQEHYFNVVNRHTAVTEEEVGTPENPQKRLVYQHKIEPGVTKIEHYGLALAAKTNLAEDTVKLAMELAELISSNTVVQEIRTPQNNDAQSLYNLNATIQQECRKYNNSTETVKRILHKFKEDNPQIINRVQLQCSRSDNKTDMSAECSYVPYAEEKSLISHEDSDTNKVTKNIRTPIPKFPVEHLELVDEVQHRNYASVQSSEQLLNSVIHNDDSAEADDGNTSDIEMVRYDNDEVAKANDYVEESNDQFQQSFNNEMHDHPTPPGNNIDMNEEDTNATETSSLDSDIAEALTQIVEEYSSKNVTHSQKSSDMSIDEDLINETIHEINEELSNEASSVENIILTPPLSFRDM